MAQNPYLRVLVADGYYDKLYFWPESRSRSSTSTRSFEAGSASPPTRGAT